MLIKSITNMPNLERVTLNFSFNKIQDLKYLENALTMLKHISYLELKLYQTEVDLRKILELIDCLKEELFVLNFSLKMLKISCDRYQPILLLKHRVEEICYESNSGNNRKLRTDIVGFDNKYYTIYIKKNDKPNTNRNRGTVALKKPNLLPKMNTMS